MRLYTSDGWADIPSIVSRSRPFTIVVGGRGTGKTFGALQYAQEKALAGDGRFMYLRRLQSQVDLISRPEYSPFKSVDRVTGLDTVSKALTKYTSGFYVDGSLTGYCAALSTFANLRGFDGSDIDLLILDEAIPEHHERPLKEEFAAFLNCYETINRNRELEGRKPLQALLMANSNALGNPYFLGWGLVKKSLDMIRKNSSVYDDPSRGLLLVMLHDSPVSEQKKDTALYRSSENIREMALENRFYDKDLSTYCNRHPRELEPLAICGEICFYRIKNGDGYHCTTHRSGSPPVYEASPLDIKRFIRDKGFLLNSYLSRRLTFDSPDSEFIFRSYFNT